MSKPIFAIKKGMSDEILWNEIDKIGVSGESKQEVVSFKKPEKEHVQLRNQPLHNVIMSNEQYAIIRKIHTTTDSLGGVTDKYLYYLCGINDEDQYFIRPLIKVPKTVRTIDEIVDWVNRKEQGFTDRLQGDVVFKFVDLMPKKEEETTKPKKRSVRELNEQLDVLADVEIAQPRINPQLPQQPFGLGVGVGLDSNPFQTSFQRPRRRKSRFSVVESLLAGQESSSGMLIIDNVRYRKVDETPLKLGNHKLFTEGDIFIGETEPFVAIIAESVVLQHYEHRIIEKKIPQGFALVLSAQRGRDFKLKEYLTKAFD
jgi:hypothetical protein